MVFAIDASRANKKERTGVEWYSYHLIEEFKKTIPPDVRVVLYMQNEPTADLLPIPASWQIKILRWPFPFWTIFRLSLEMLWKKPDIFFSPANILPYFTPSKTSTTIHDVGFVCFSDCYSHSERRLQNFGVRRALTAATIFTPSNFTKQELMKIYSADPSKIFVTHLGHNTELLTAVSNSVNNAAEEYNIKKPYFLFVGRKERKKNIDGIMKAFKIFSEKHSDYSLVLAGPNANYELPISNYEVVNIAWIDNEERSYLMRNAEALLFPSLYEGFGLPILEAFNAGIPVITSNFSSMPEVAGEATLLIDPKNPADIAHAMERLITNPELKSRLVNAGLARLAKFSWEKCARETLTVIFPKNNGLG
jgi:glycosyltransferase involved in cell wall biosynthesis